MTLARSVAGCPFCYPAFSSQSGNAPEAGDVFFENESVIGFISPKWWARNRGHAIIIPKDHYPNIYSIPSGTLSQVFEVSRLTARALKADRLCEGTSLRQHNERAGNQEVDHLHVHVFPRWANDHLYGTEPEIGYLNRHDRASYARRLRPIIGILTRNPVLETER